MELTLNKDNLKILLTEILSELLNQQARSSDISLKKFYQDYVLWTESNLSPKSQIGVKSAFKHLIAFRGDVQLKEIDSLFIDQFMIYLMKKVPKGFLIYFRTIRSSFSKAVEWNYITINFFAKYKPPKIQQNEKKIFSKDEFLSLMEKESNQTLRSLYSITFYCGLRLSEVQSLCWNSVFLKEKYLVIGTEKFKTKSRKSRRVPLCESAIIILENLLPKVLPIEKDVHVFRKTNNYPYSINYITKHFSELLRSAGYSEGYSFHSIRHSAASFLSSEGIPLLYIQKILGHSDIKTTSIYLHHNFNELLSSVSKFDNMELTPLKEIAQ